MLRNFLIISLKRGLSMKDKLAIKNKRKSVGEKVSRQARRSRFWRFCFDGAMRRFFPACWIPTFVGMTAVLTFLENECGSIFSEKV
jgi:hypothetical protein